MISRWLRIAATGTSFAVFGVAGLALTLLVFPLVRRLPGDERRRQERAQRIVHRAFQGFVRFMAALGILEVSVQGADRLRRPGGYVVVANHPTLLDVVMLGALAPQLDCVVKQAVARNPFMRGVVRATGYLCNDLGGELLEACAQRLRQGRSLLLFPEGTRSPKGALGPFQRGAAHVALSSGRPLLPVVVRCDPPSLMRDQKWYDVPERKLRFTLEIAEPIDPARAAGDGATRAIAARRLTASLRDFYLEKLHYLDARGVGDALEGRHLQVGRGRAEGGVPVPR